MSQRTNRCPFSSPFPVSSFAARLQEIIGEYQSITSWARRVGIAGSTLNGILTKGSMPTTKNLIKIAMNTNISLNWLLADRGPKNLPMDSESTNEDVNSTEESCYDSGNTGSCSDDEEFLFPNARFKGILPTGYPVAARCLEGDDLGFRNRWLKQHLRVDPSNVILVKIRGDAMAPTLKDGDIVLVDVREGLSRFDGLYVLQMDHLLVVKRLQYHPDGSVIIRSDNSEYERVVLSSKEVGHLRIVGLVIWYGRAL